MNATDMARSVVMQPRPQAVSDMEALDAMQRLGGGFASALATAWRRADASNAARLRDAFGDLLERYRAIAPQVCCEVEERDDTRAEERAAWRAARDENDGEQP